jgi:rare lipoprotein A
MNKFNKYITLTITILALSANIHAKDKKTQIGKGSWYGKQFNGHITASGEKYNMYSYTAAHRTLPFNTMVEVTNLQNGRSLIVRVNDRGPYAKGRIMDLSYLAAKKLGYINRGIAKLKIKALYRQKKIKK